MTSADFKKLVEQRAEAYCDRPRCANITRDCKTWHRMKTAFTAGATDPTITKCIELRERLRAIDELSQLVTGNFFNDMSSFHKEFEKAEAELRALLDGGYVADK